MIKHTVFKHAKMPNTAESFADDDIFKSTLLFLVQIFRQKLPTASIFSPEFRRTQNFPHFHRFRLNDSQELQSEVVFQIAFAVIRWITYVYLLHIIVGLLGLSLYIQCLSLDTILFSITALG